MLRWLLTGGAVPVLLVLCGTFFLIYLRGLPFRAPGRMLRALRTPGEAGVSPFRAVTLALAGTLGVGNIVGVANAVAVGGAGAIFWMWVSALAAMVLKYAEILVAVAHRRSDGNGGYYGGAVYYIRDLTGRRKPGRRAIPVAGIFAVLLVTDALTMGCIIQVNAVTSACRGVFSVPSIAVAAVIFVLTMPLLIRGTRGISAVTEYLVPLMSAGYLVLSVAVLILRREAVTDAFLSIFKEAFHPRSACGGVLGFLTSQALRAGTMRGLLSNEAGCGSAPTAHASANAKSPADQGIWGIFEVFADTILLCTATALVLLVNYPEVESFGDNAVMMTIRAYTATLGEFAGWFFAAAVFCFGFATVVCWGAYGLEAIRSLSRRRGTRRGYFLLFGAGILLGAVAPLSWIWDVSDFAIGGMTLINLTVLIGYRREIRAETFRWAENRDAPDGEEKRTGGAVSSLPGRF